MNVPEKWRLLAHAWVDGAEVETLCDARWLPNPMPAWGMGCEYRIKPKPKVKKWRWVYEFGSPGDLAITDGWYSRPEEWKVIGNYNPLVEKIDCTEIEVDDE